MLRIYLDTCAIQRPLDTRNQTRITLEAEAVLGILSACNAGVLALITSDVLILEANQCALLLRRDHAYAIIDTSNEHQPTSPTIIEMARLWTYQGLRPMDALHLASAKIAMCDYFVTCDDVFLKRARKLNLMSLYVINPIELIQEIGI